jgi:flagellar hook-length control protein FliK
LIPEQEVESNRIIQEILPHSEIQTSWVGSTTEPVSQAEDLLKYPPASSIHTNVENKTVQAQSDPIPPGGSTEVSSSQSPQPGGPGQNDSGTEPGLQNPEKQPNEIHGRPAQARPLPYQDQAGTAIGSSVDLATREGSLPAGVRDTVFVTIKDLGPVTGTESHEAVKQIADQGSEAKPDQIVRLAHRVVETTVEDASLLNPKPGEGRQLPEVRHHELVRQIGEGLEELAGRHGTSLTLRLEPEDLGVIQLRLAQGSGGLQVHIHAEQPATGLLLERYLDDLRQALDQARVDLNQLLVGYGERQGQPGSSNAWGSPEQGGRNHLPSGREARVDRDRQPEGARPVNPISSTSQVDYRI